MRIRAFSGVVAIASIALLAGCASATPAEPAAPTASGTPAAEEAPAITTLVVDGSSFSSLDAGGDTVATVDYTATTTDALAFLTDVFGSEPVVTARTGDSTCVADATQATWGNDEFVLLYDFAAVGGIPEAQTISVRAKAATVNDVTVQTPQSVRVGDPMADLAGAIPGVGTHVHLGDASYTYADYAVVSGTYEDMTDADFGTSDNAYWGAQAEAKDGQIVTLSAPVYFQSAC